MAISYILPSINATGAVTLLEPFSGLVADNLPYKVVAIRTLYDIIAAGQDPYGIYYEPYEIPESKFTDDVDNDVCIITLATAGGDVVYVPNSYLKTLPVATGMPYASMMVGVNLGALPTDLSLSYFCSRVQQLAHDLLGVNNAEVRAIKASDVTYLTIEDAAAIEAARQVVMSAVVTDSAKLAASEAARAEMSQVIAEQEAYILANPNPTP